MSSLIIWYSGNPYVTRSTNDIGRFFTKKLDIPSRWPLLLDARQADCANLTSTYTYAPAAQFNPCHQDAANVLMADGSFSTLKYYETKFNEATLNSNPLPYARGIK